MTTTYPFTQAAFVFGIRKGPTLGLMFHGAEGESGVVGYLARNPARGVSANFVCERSGQMVRMTGFAEASGSLNPRDRSSDKAYYGASHLKAVLGSWWTDPNSVVISVEIEMFARKGPNPDQVEGLIAWAADMKRRYPTIRGALGHADQTNTKGCPGTTPAMRAVFGAIGGHGLWSTKPPKEEPMQTFTFLPETTIGSVVVDTPGHAYQRLADGSLHGPIKPTWVKGIALGPVKLATPIPGGAPGADRSTAYIVGDEAAALLASDVTFTPRVIPADPAAIAAAVDAALTHVEGPASAVLTAIKEARPA